MWKEKVHNEWYPRGLQISLHIRSPGLQDYSKVWNLKFFRFFLGGGILKLSDLDSWQFSFGGDILKLSDLDSDNFHFGGYSETLGFGLSDNFHWGGILKLSDLDSDNFHLGGILKLSDLDSLTIFIGGGSSELQNRGYSEDFGPKFQPFQQADGSQIVSHMWRLINWNTFG